MENGSVAITGASTFALIETYDAWLTPWFFQYQTNPYAPGRGGAFLAVYEKGLQRLRLSTIVPGLQRGSLASRRKAGEIFLCCPEFDLGAVQLSSAWVRFW